MIIQSFLKSRSTVPCHGPSHRTLSSSSLVRAPVSRDCILSASVRPSTSLPLSSLSSPGAIAATALTAQSTASVGFLQFICIFIAGGLFFSSVLAAATALVAVGKANLLQIWDIFAFLSRKVWNVFVVGLRETREALRMDGKWRWKDAWRALKKTLLETKQIAAKGVEAFRAESKLYRAAVGAPGLIPLQYAIDRLMPYSLSSMLQESLTDTLRNIKDDNVRRVQLLEFSAGTVAPQLMGARVYDLQEDALAYDCDIKWESELSFKMQVITRRLGFKVPVTVKNVKFEGTVRIELVPLVKKPPGYQAIIVAFPTVPKVNLDVTVAGGDITRVPWLKKEVLQGIRKSIEEEFLWPKRIVLPAEPSTPKDVLERFSKTDPLLEAEAKLTETALLEDFNRLPDTKSLRKQLKVKFGS